MKQYVIDELRPKDYEDLKSYLNDNLSAGSIDGVYWISIEPGLFTEEQAAHTECQPFYFVADLEPTRLSCEFLVRTHSKIRCSCMGYATERQRNWIIRYIDDIFKKLDIVT